MGAGQRSWTEEQSTGHLQPRTLVRAVPWDVREEGIWLWEKSQQKQNSPKIQKQGDRPHRAPQDEDTEGGTPPETPSFPGRSPGSEMARVHLDTEEPKAHPNA